MPYGDYIEYALEEIRLELLKDSLELCNSTWEQAREIFLRYVSTNADSFLAFFQEQYGACFQSELWVLWPVFLRGICKDHV